MVSLLVAGLLWIADSDLGASADGSNDGSEPATDSSKKSGVTP